MKIMIASDIHGSAYYCDLLLFGHTHVPERLDTGKCVCLNPGSVSLPKNGSRHSCMVMDGDVFRWLDLVRNYAEFNQSFSA